TLIFNRSDDITFSGAVSGSGSLIHAGTGGLTLTGANTYTGGTIVKGGILRVGDGETAGSITGNVVVGHYGDLIFARSDDITFSGVVSGRGSVTQEGTGTLTLSGDNTYSGSTSVFNGGVLQISKASN